jgi:large subunit ribosomal protein L3
MSMGLVGRKCGMTRIFLETGESVPVTVVEVPKNCVTQVKTEARDGYSALQITAGTAKISRTNKSIAGVYKKAGIESGAFLMEFPLNAEDCADIKLGHEFNVDLFEEGQKVDVTSVSRGKGFAGVIKRHNFQMQDATHGNSLAHRAPGSIGQCQTPGRVFKGKKMAGQMGNVKVTVQNQPIIKVDLERQLLLIRGTIPGAPGARVVIKKAVKDPKKKGGAK